MLRGLQCARPARCVPLGRQAESSEEQARAHPSALAVLAAALADESGALPTLLVTRHQPAEQAKATSYTAGAYGSYATMPVPEDDVLDESNADVLAMVGGAHGGGFGRGSSSPRPFGSSTPRGKAVDKLDENDDASVESTDFGATVETEDPTDALGGEDDARVLAERTRRAVLAKLHRVSVRQLKLQEFVAAK